MSAHRHELLPTTSLDPIRVGIDIGRVILEADTDTRRAFMDLSSTRYIDGALEAISDLVADERVEDVVLVSKCGLRIRQNTEEFLLSSNFYAKTTLSESNVIFCFTRPEKGIIAEDLGLTHFIDDREDVLANMPDNVKNRLLFTQEDTLKRGRQKTRYPYKVVKGWHNTWLAIQETMVPKL